MAVTSDKPGPYTAAAAIIQFLTLNRSRGLPPTITGEVLARAGIAESLIPRTLQALQTLDLITAEGAPTPTLEALRRAPEAEYQARMAEWLNATYADVLQYIDPATADEVAVRDAFRSYNPVGQQARMVSLFIGLYAAAGVREATQTRPQQRPPAARPRVNRPAPRAPMYKTSVKAAIGTATSSSGLPPPLAALLADLPPQGGTWSQQRRDKFLGMFESMLDYYYNVGDEIPLDTDDQEAA
jgi:hypothetical protein